MRIPLAIGCLLLASIQLCSQFSGEQHLFRAPFANCASLECHDLNGDGTADILAGTGRGVQVSNGVGDGTYDEPVVLFALGDQEVMTTAGDLNADGIVDVVFGSKEGGELGWLPGMGAGAFGPPQLITNSGQPCLQIWAVDLDADDDLDVVACRSSGIRLYPNDGNGVIGAEMALVDAVMGYPPFNGGERTPTAIGDIDGDGLPDLVLSSMGSNAVRWFKNQGGASFTSMGNLHSGIENDTRSIALADLDNDGDLDAAAAVFGEGVHAYRNLGNGTFSSQYVVVSDLIPSPILVRTSDIDGDGDTDLVVSNNGGDVQSVAVNGGDGTTWTTASLGFSLFMEGVTAMTLHDADDDGDEDLFRGGYNNGNITVAENDGDGLFMAPFSPDLIFGTLVRLHAARLNTDPYPDIMAVTIDPGTVLVGLTDTSGAVSEFFRLDSLTPGNGRLSWGDVDADGDMDLVRSIEYYSVLLYRNDGTGHFAGPELLAEVSGVTDIELADLDADVDRDLVFVAGDAVRAGFLRNNGDGAFDTQVNLTSSANQTNTPRLLRVGDADNDGDQDVLFHVGNDCSYTSGQIRYIRNNGTWAGYPLPVVNLAQANSRVITFDLADMDADDDIDLLVAHDCNPSELRSARNNGFGTYTNTLLDSDLAYALNWSSFMDVDGDGDRDAVAAYESLAGSGRMAWYANDGAGQFGAELAISPWGDQKQWGAVVDMDADGDEDLLLGSAKHQSIFWLENFHGSPYRVEGRVYYDVDGDGASDPEEPGFPFAPLTLAPVGSLPFTNELGEFAFSVDTGSYTVGHGVGSGLWQLTSTPANYTVSVSEAQPVAEGSDFGFLPASGSTFADPWYTTSAGVCGDTILHWLGVTNTGNTILRGKLTVVLDSAFAFWSSDSIPLLVTGDTISWWVDSVFYFDHVTIPINVISPGVEALGDTVIMSMTFLAYDEDSLPVAEFSHERSWVVTCAYDPNAKEVEPVGYGQYGAIDIATDELVYTIHFQNTGTDTALTVMLRDQLDGPLDPGTLRVLGASHTITGMYIEADGELVFLFEGIQLPDSGADQLGSQGFVRFAIAPDNEVQHLAEVENTAGILFDLNPPIITNTVLNTFVDCAAFAATITIIGPGVLQAGEGDRYQWYLDGEAIAGATSRELVVTLSGQYSVELVNAYGCVLLSTELEVIATGVAEPGALAMGIVPNPVNDVARVIFSDVPGNGTSLQLIDATGRVIHSVPTDGRSEVMLDRRNVISGMYVLCIMQHGRVLAARRVVME